MHEEQPGIRDDGMLEKKGITVENMPEKQKGTRQKYGNKQQGSSKKGPKGKNQTIRKYTRNVGRDYAGK